MNSIRPSHLVLAILTSTVIADPAHACPGCPGMVPMAPISATPPPSAKPPNINVNVPRVEVPRPDVKTSGGQGGTNKKTKITKEQWEQLHGEKKQQVQNTQDEKGNHHIKGQKVRHIPEAEVDQLVNDVIDRKYFLEPPAERGLRIGKQLATDAKEAARQSIENEKKLELQRQFNRNPATKADQEDTRRRQREAEPKHPGNMDQTDPDPMKEGHDKRGLPGKGPTGYEDVMGPLPARSPSPSPFGGLDPRR
jgi:hypothetical protein